MDVTGTTVGHYRIGRILGRGGMGAVHEAVDSRNDLHVAFKILLRPDASTHDATLAARRLYDEATAASTLRHPFLVPLLDAGQDPALGPWLVYPFLPGGSLRDRLSKGPLPRHRIGDDLAVPLLGALEALHVRGTVHRDVKPENLLADSEGRFHLADLGLAWFQGRQARTATGVIVATPAYCSPERILAPNDPPTAACDVWAAAATLAEALTGRPLMDPEVSATNLQTVLTRGYPASELRSRGLSPALAHALAPALAREPGGRPSAADLLQTLTAALERPDAPPTTLPTRFDLRPRHPEPAPVSSPGSVPLARRSRIPAALVLFLCLLTLGLLRLRSSPPPPTPTLPPTFAPLLNALRDAAVALGPAPLPDPLLTDRLLGTADLLFHAADAEGLPWHLVADATRQALDGLPPDGLVQGLVTAAALQAQGNRALASARIEAEGKRLADLLAAPGPTPPRDSPLLVAVVAARRLHGDPEPGVEAESFLDDLASRIRRLPPPLRCSDGARAARLALTFFRGRGLRGDDVVTAGRRDNAALALALGPPTLKDLAAGWGLTTPGLASPPPASLDEACWHAATALGGALAADDALRSFVDDNYDGAISAAVKGIAPASMAAAASKLSAAARTLETLSWLAPDRADVRLQAIMSLARIGRCLRRGLFYQNFYKPEYFAPDDTEDILLDRLLDLLSLDLAVPRPSEPEALALHDARRLMVNWLPLDVMLRNWPEALPTWDERVGSTMDDRNPVDRLLKAYRALARSPGADALEGETVEALRLMPLASPPTTGTLGRRAYAILLQGRILRMGGAFKAARDQARAEQEAVEALHPSPATDPGPLFELWSLAVICRASAAWHLGDRTGDGQLEALRGIAAHSPVELRTPRYAADLLSGKSIIPERP